MRAAGERFRRAGAHGRPEGVDPADRDAAGGGEIHRLVPEGRAGMSIDGRDEIFPVRLISPSGLGVRTCAGGKARQLIVLVDIALAQAQNGLQDTCHGTGAVGPGGTVEIHRFVVRYGRDHTVQDFLPRSLIGKTVPDKVRRAVKPDVTTQRGRRAVGFFRAAQIQLMAHTARTDEHVSIGGCDLTAAKEQPVSDRAAVTGPAAQVPDVGGVGRFYPPQTVQGLQRTGLIAGGKGRFGVRLLVVVGCAADCLADGLGVGGDGLRWGIACDLRCAVIARVIGHIGQIIPHRLRALMPFKIFYSASTL